MKLHLFTILVLGLFITGGLASAGSDQSWLSEDRLEASANAFKSLQGNFPDLKVYKHGGMVTRLYGTAFGTGATTAATAERFVSERAQVFGLQSSELAPGDLSLDRRFSQPIMFDDQSGTYKFTMYYYHQVRDGIPVHHAELRLLVSNAADHKLVLAVSTLRDLGELSPDRGFVGSYSMTAEQAARSDEPDLTDFSDQEAVIFAGTADQVQTPQMGVRFVGSSDFPQGFKYVVEPSSGEILYKEDLIVFEDINGNVSGLATEGIGAEHCESEVSTGAPWARVAVGSSYTYADQSGDFVISNSGTSAVTVTSELRGLWFRVQNYTGSEPILSQSVTPPGPADFLHNPSNTEPVRAQVNAYIEANGVRDLVIEANPSYPALSQSEFPIYCNRTDGYCPGNAWYDSQEQSLNFCSSGDGYPNTAWSSVIHHEYGHRLVNAAGSGQGMYGEGLGDCMSVCMLDSPLLGVGFYGDCGSPLRNADNTMQYPCSGTIHTCGQLLSGCVWDTRNNLVATEPVDYLDILADLCVNSILLHTGDQITPQITIDFLTLDDDDGNLGNGSPHYAEINSGFTAHNMAGPELALLVFSYPSGVPTMLTPGASTVVEVIVTAQDGTPDPGTGRVHYSIDGGAYSNELMTETSSNHYEATLPALDCYQTIVFYFSAEAIGGTVVYDPNPGDANQAIVATDQITLWTDGFESNQGWSFSGGNWGIGTPSGGGGEYGGPDPSSGHTGSGVLGYDLGGDYENSMPEYHTTSPALDCTDLVGAKLSFWRWLGVEQPSYDHAYIRVSNNGSSWTTIWENDGTITDDSWSQHEFDISAVADGNSTVYIRFTMGETDSGWRYCGWNIDDLVVSGFECTENRPIISTPSVPDWTEGHPYSVTLDAISGTPPYTWSDKNGDLAGTGLSLSTTGVLSGTPTSVGTLTFTARVVDDASEADEEVFSFDIALAVTITTTSLPDWTAGHPYAQTVAASGGTGGLTVTDQYGDLVGTGLTLAGGGLLSGTPVAGPVSFTALATDAVGADDTQALSFTVNSTLNITTVTVPDGIKSVLYSHQLTHAGGTGTIGYADLNGDLVGTGLSLGASGLIFGTPVDTGQISLTVRVTDQVGATDDHAFSFVIVDILHITTTTVPDWTQYWPILQQLEAVGAQGATSWSDKNGDLAGTGLTLASDGMLSGSPTPVGTITFTAQVSDEGKYVDEREFSFDVAAEVVIAVTTLPDWTEGVPYSQTLTATGGTWSLEWTDQSGDLTAYGLAIGLVSGEVNGTPSASGAVSFTAVATDKIGANDTRPFDFVINPRPSVTTDTLPDATQGSAYSYTIAVTGGTGALIVTDKFDNLVGTGLALAVDGTISGTPIDSGVISFIARVEDELGGSGQKSFDLRVVPALQIVTDDLPNWTQNASYSFQLESTTGSGVVIWSDKNGDLSGTGLTLAADGLLSGTPGTVGPISFTAMVTDDGSGHDEKLLALTINPAIAITTTSLPEWTVGAVYADLVEASGGTGPISFSDLNGDLTGTGLVLGAGGTISGTPGVIGDIVFTAHAEDNGGGTADQPLVVHINDVVIVTTTAVPDAIDGTPYTETLASSGGTAPVSWTDLYGDLSGTGLTLSSDGVISGTPVSEQTIAFTAQVEDLAGINDGQALTIIVGPSWICGDIDGNGVGPDVADLVYMVSWMFQEGPEPSEMAAVDVDGQGGVGDIADLVYLVTFMFSDGPALDCQGSGAVSVSTSATNAR